MQDAHGRACLDGARMVLLFDVLRPGRGEPCMARLEHNASYTNSSGRHAYVRLIQGYLTPGDTVGVELPDRSLCAGTLRDLRCNHSSARGWDTGSLK